MKAGIIQIESSGDVSKSLFHAQQLVQRAVAEGAELVVLPEEFATLGISNEEKLSIKESYGQGKIQDALKEMAYHNKTWIIGGTIPLASDAPHKVHASCLVVGSDGEVRARYDKIHLFDAKLDETESYQESKIVKAGNEIVKVNTPLGEVGLTVCYDVRFPEMFRLLIDKGVTFFAVPAAFTEKTGKAHWEVLLRARAIENLSYILAAGHCGKRYDGKSTYGHSMIIDPWGNILRSMEKGEGVLVADIDKAHIQSLRQQFPALSHRCH